MSDLEIKLVKLCDGILALVDWEAELRDAGEIDRAAEVRAHLVQMIEFAVRIPASTLDSLCAKRDALFAIMNARGDLDGHAAVRALRASIDMDGKRFGAGDHQLLN